MQSYSYATESNLRVDENNVISSASEDLEITQQLLHEFVWENLDRWVDKTAMVRKESSEWRGCINFIIVVGKNLLLQVPIIAGHIASGFITRTYFLL